MASAVLHDSGVEIRPDAGRVVARFFVPGLEDVGPGDSRAAVVVERILQLSDGEVDASMLDVEHRLGDRHRDLRGVFEEHARRIAQRLEATRHLSHARRLLLGACFTQESAVEGAALCNPSIVALTEGDDARVVLSVRGIGEGHRSSLGFRTGAVAPDGTVTLDPTTAFAEIASAEPGRHRRSVLRRQLAGLGDDQENADYLLDPLPEVFDDDLLQRRVTRLREGAATRRDTATTIANIERLVGSSYRAEFPASTHLSERVLWPQAASEVHGIEDARFVKITDASAPTYCATYTAFDGSAITQCLLTTEDFRSFELGPMAGAAAKGKGLALFPRQIDGRYVALTRADRETNSIARSDDLRCWDDAEPIQRPQRGWEVLQLGNCGSPVETPDGWLVLTHGVGPMRTYSIGALLLDLEDPRQVVARSEEPLLSPGREQRDGYVPNVVYSCGSLLHGDHLVVPYGIGDQSIRVATGRLSEVVAAMRRTAG